MTNKLKQVIQSQYHAALTMLENSVKGCPVSLWEDKTYKNQYWQIAFHTLYYTHYYLGDFETSFEPWEKYKKDYQYLTPSSSALFIEPYSQQDVLEYLKFCRKQVDERIPNTRLDNPSGLEWLPTTKLELLLYNLRHIQHHAGQLIDRLRIHSDIPSEWIDMGQNINQGDKNEQHS
jgi:uncharacterized damage-inducible protein DinB